VFTIAVTKSYSTRTTSNGELLNILAGHHTTPFGCAKLFETLIPVFAEYDRKEFLLRDNSQSYNYHDSLDFIMPLFLFLHKEYQIKYDDFWVYNYEVMVSNIICINILLIYIYT